MASVLPDPAFCARVEDICDEVATLVITRVESHAPDTKARLKLWDAVMGRVVVRYLMSRKSINDDRVRLMAHFCMHIASALGQAMAEALVDDSVTRH